MNAPFEIIEQPESAEEAPTASLAVFDPIKAGLAEAKKRYANVAFDLTTTKGNDEARKARKELVSIRTGVDKAYTAWNQPLLEQQRKARALRDQITKEVEQLEQPIDAQIKADEKRREDEKAEKERIERERVAAIRARINDIFAQPAACAGLPSKEIELSIVGVEVLLTDKAFYAEFQGEAEAAAEVVLTKLNAMFNTAREQEAAAERQRLEAERLAAERAELERQRAELAAQQEAARKEAERIAAEAAAAAAAEAARIAAERAATEAAERARQAAIAEEARRAEEARQAAEREAQERIAEQQRQLDEQRAEFDRQQAAAREAAQRSLERTEKPGLLAGATILHYAPTAGANNEAPPDDDPTPLLGEDKTAGSSSGNPAQESLRAALLAGPTGLDETAKPELRTQEDAFAEERAAAAADAAAAPAKVTERPSDEEITKAVAKAFGATEFEAAQWLGSYDCLAEIDRAVGAA